jgi:hypothetical protein
MECAKDREEFRSFRKSYEIDREEQNRTDNIELRKLISIPSLKKSASSRAIHVISRITR